MEMLKKLALFGLMVIITLGFALPAMAITISTDRAKTIALRVYPGATVIRVEHREKTDVPYYTVKLEIDGVTVEVKMNANTGVLLDGYNLNLLSKAKITPDEARNIALGLHIDATIIKMEIEYEKGSLVYEIEVRQATGKKAEIYVCATTGEVLK